MKRILKIILTNWINIAGVFAITYTCVTIMDLLCETQYNLFQALLAAGMLVCLYGMIFWALFISQLIALDLLLFGFSKGNVKVKLLIEWVIISAPFAYWAIEYDEWVFTVGIIGFALSQFLRAKKIMK